MNMDRSSLTAPDRWRWLAMLAAGTIFGLLMASSASAQLTLAYSASSVSVAQVAMATLDIGCSPPKLPQCSWLVTAVKDTSDNLRVMVWQDTGKAIVQTDSHTAGPIIFNLGVTVLSANMFVTAAFTKSGPLELISWQVSSTGMVTRLMDFTSTQGGTTVDVTRGPLDATCNCFATATDSSSNLTVSVWNVDPSTGAITQGPTKVGGATTRVAIAGSGLDVFWTAIGNNSGNLVVTAWDYSKGTLTQWGSKTGTTFDHVSATYLWGVDPYITTTAVIDSAGNLDVINWQTPNTPNASPSLQASGTGGPVSISTVSQGKDVSVTSQGNLYPFTAVRDSNGNLFLQAWNGGIPTIGTQYELKPKTPIPITQVSVVSENLTIASLNPPVHIVAATHAGTTGPLILTVFALSE